MKYAQIFIGIYTSEIDFNAKTITNDTAPYYTEGVIAGANC